MHNGLPLSLLDFLLVTAMLLVTPSDEWMNVTRAGPSESFTDLNHSISTSSGFEGLQPSETRPSSSSLSSETPDPVVLEQNTEATPAIENWRSHIPRNRDDDQSRYAESVNGPASPTASRTTSRTSFHTDTQSTTNHAAHPSVQGMYSVQSSSSLSLASHAFSATQNSNRRTRELPTPPVQSSSHGYTYGRGPSSASSHVSHASYAGYPRPSHDEPPPIPPLPASSSASAPPRTSRPSAPTPIIVPSRHTTASPTFSVHARSLPIPPTPSTSKPPIPSLPPLSMPSTSIASTPSSPIPGPASSVPHVPSLPRSQSFSHLQQRAAQQQHEYHSPVKAPPNYAASAHDPTPLPSVPRPGPGPATNHQPLSIRTTDVGPAPGLPSAADARVGTGAVVLTPDDTEAELYDFPPPAYSAIDMARSPLRLHAVNGDEGMQ
ncbi:hypothetical protein BC834DRAFT_90164 [Gloeopeniophorella convolvens]|nr:hypothetical protein BC834DRAFT_90164 [Gloeopeniophorella convolvens]